MEYLRSRYGRDTALANPLGCAEVKGFQIRHLRRWWLMVTVPLRWPKGSSPVVGVSRDSAGVVERRDVLGDPRSAYFAFHFWHRTGTLRSP